MGKKFVLLQALALLIAVYQYDMGAAGQKEGRHSNKIQSNVFYPYLTARMPIAGSGVDEWLATTAQMKHARIRVRRRRIYRWCRRLPLRTMLSQKLIGILYIACIRPVRLWILKMREKFVLLQALAVFQYGMGAAGQKEGTESNEILGNVFYIARKPIAGSGVDEWLVTTARMNDASIHVHQRRIYLSCLRLHLWTMLIGILYIYGSTCRKARTIWFYCTDKVYHYRRKLKSMFCHTLIECGALVTKMLLMISGDVESNPGPGLDQVTEMLPSVDDSPLGEQDLVDILEEMMPLVARWKAIGRGFRIDSGRLDQIQADNRGDSQECLAAVLTCWLRKNYDVQTFGEPTWRTVVKVVARPVAGNNCALAMSIAGRHSGIQQICVQSEAVPPTEIPKGDVGGTQQPSDCTTYQSYCRNIRAVYECTPCVEPGVWPPTMGRVQYINLAILKSEKLTVSDDTIMTIQRSADDILCKEETIGYMELFHGLERGSKILVEGRPGCGKTTLLNSISHDWATGKILTSIGLLLLVPLRRFHGKTTEVGLNDMLQLYDTGDLCRSVGTQISLSGGEGVCILLDGLDEYPECSVPGNFVLELLKRNKLPNAVIVSSSRPAAAHHLREYASKRVEVLGFLVPQIQQYVEEHYKQDDEKLKSLNTYLECHPNIRRMCYLPLHLAMVVYLNDILKGKPLPHTETGVYYKFAKYTLFRDERRDPQSNLEQLSDLKQLHPETLEVFRNICSLAFSATVLSQQIFSREEVQKVLGSSEVRLEGLGLLTEDKLLGEDGLEKTYSFSHLTFQEFLAAYHLTELPAAEQIKAAKEHAGDKHMRVTWKFYCGLTKLTGGVAMDVFRVLLQQGRFSRLLLILSVHESQNQGACCELLFSTNGVLHIIDEVLTPADMLAVAYCLLNASTSLTELRIHNCHLGNEELRIVTSECSFLFTNLKYLRFVPKWIDDLLFTCRVY